MSNNLLSLVWQNSRSTNGARLVALCLANHDREDGKGVWMSVGTIAKLCAMDARATQRAMKKLASIGELEVETGAGPMATNVYRLTPPRQNATPGKTPPRQNAGGGVLAIPPGVLDTTPPGKTPPNTEEKRKDTLSLPAGGLESASTPPEITFPPPPAASERGFAFADWFRTTLPAKVAAGLLPSWRVSWARCFDDILRLDGATAEDVFAACKYARGDTRFWARNFYSPLKLRDRGADGIKYLVKFLEDAKTPTHNGSTRASSPANAGTANAARADDY